MSNSALEAIMSGDFPGGLDLGLGGGLAAAAKRLAEKEKELDTPATAEQIRDLGQIYLVPHQFAPGDLVQWKPSMKNAKWPHYGEPAVVMEVLPGRRHPSTEGGSSYADEPEEVRVGILRDGHLRGFWQDGNRFEPYVEPQTTENQATGAADAGAEE